MREPIGVVSYFAKTTLAVATFNILVKSTYVEGKTYYI